ncbi:MAG: VaFE repeat-containing surface-anchored protein [Roseburia hominis]|uniref:VaFE repeat-containing surface-anchored protein n=1 Tax=Roseburia hominis TaxID=301301 RepID=UPI00290F0861|nr:VaFE repeat-containing surface-anchored protein [Roseburia hominis]MDU6919939.1 VaFE repeat-containing surface-anchored protein [Roseburia hominis]
MNKLVKRLLTGTLAFATILTALPVTAVHASGNQYWTESAERVGYIEHVMNDGSIKSTFNEGHMKVEGETAYCVDINTSFKNGYKTRSDASSRMSSDQIADVALSLEYVKQYTATHTNLNYKQGYLLEQCVVWQRLSEQLGWQCDNVRASYNEISQAVQNEVYAGAKAFVKANKGRYECGGYIYTGEGQDIGQFWAKLNVGNAKVKKTSSNPTVTDGNANYFFEGATFGVYSDKGCNSQLATLTADGNGDTKEVEVKAGTVYIKELSAPKGYKLDSTVHALNVEVGKTATLTVADTPKVTETLIDLFKIDMETGKSTPQGTASLEGAEFTWSYYDGYYNADNLPAKATRTWTTKTVAEKDSDGTIHYVSRLADSYKVSGDSFYTQDGKNVLPLGTLTVTETKAPNGYLLDGAYMQADGSSEQIKGTYLTQISEDGELAVLSGSNQYSVSDKVIRGGVKIQKRDLETKDTKAQGSATLQYTELNIISLNDNPVLVEGKLYNKNETVKKIQTGIDGIASTSADLLPYGNYRLEESKAPEGYLTDGAKEIDFSITEDGKIVDLTDKSHSVYNQIKRGDIEGVKIGAGTHKRLAGVPFRITSKTTGESHIVVTDKNGQFSTASSWASHKVNTNAGKSSENGVWFGTSEPDDSKIHTTATDKKTGEKMIVAGKDIKIVDKVTLDGLEAGTKYKLSGWQMLKEENAELLIDGKRVDSNYTFTADSEKMTVEITYSFDGSALGGQNLVTFEELYDISNPKEPVKVAEHKDINDDGQTVLITERIIKIHTTATDKNGKKEIEAGKDVTIVDKVTLDGLEVGTKYKLSGWQILKEENAELLIDGKKVSNDYEFTADNEKMTVEIAFTFDGSSLGGKSLVTFEELYDMTNPDEPKKVTEHKDITDDGQTVTIKEVPEVPDTPKDTDTPDTPSTVKTSDSPKTGDNTNIFAYLAMLGLSCVGLGGMLYFKRRRKKS